MDKSISISEVRLGPVIKSIAEGKAPCPHRSSKILITVDMVGTISDLFITAIWVGGSRLTERPEFSPLNKATVPV